MTHPLDSQGTTLTNPPPPQPQPPYVQQPYPPYPPYPPKKRRVWPWVVLGAVVLLFGGCVAIVGTAGKQVSDAVDAATTSINAAASEMPGAPEAPPPPLVPGTSGKLAKTIVYEVISDLPELSSLTYFDHNSELQRDPGAVAPWTKTITNSSTVAITGVGAQTKGTSVTCRITVDGKVKDEKTSTGKYAVVHCSGGF